MKTPLLLLFGVLGCSAGGAREFGENPSTGGSATGGASGSGGSKSAPGGGGSTNGGSTNGGSTNGGSSHGGSTNGGSAGSAGAAGTGDNGGYVSPVTCQPEGERPSGAPELTPGVWLDITPPGVNKADETTMIGQGLVIDPCNPSVVYWGNTPYDSSFGGLFRSTDGGTSWTKLGDRDADVDPYDDITTYLDEPLHLRIDPGDNQHFYAGDGVRGGTQGFWISTDSGNNWTKPAAWPGEKVGFDIYDVAVDPTDFKHVLASFHGAWPSAPASGVVESKDGGETWSAHEPQSGWGTGHSVKFLYDPEKGVGNSDTWLLGTQGAGYFRTEDGGQNWTKVSDIGIAHGGGSIYYAANGDLYASGYPHNLRSTDNGKTWQELVPFGGFTCVFGDGDLLYTGKLNLEAPGESLLQSAESDGTNWTPYNEQQFRNGPYEMALDSINGVIYSSNWTSGVWTLKIK